MTTLDLRQRVASAYESRWGAPPDRVLLAPGRINLIGDHTDYSLLPVLPMAIQQGIAFAVGRGPGGLSIDSLDEAGEFCVGEVAVHSASWHRYAEVAAEAARSWTDGVRVLLAGDLPSTGGLSSSSALVVGLLAAITSSSPTRLAGRALVDAAVDAERRAAIEGGAMDQTAIVFGEPGAALRIDFDPPSIRPIALPEELLFVAAYSGERASKGAAARNAYNAGVVGARCATALLANATGENLPDPLVLGRLRKTTPEVVDELPKTVTPAEVSARTGVALAQLVGLSAADYPKEGRVAPQSVARHVLGEAAAVSEAEHALRERDLDRFGALMNASHQSLRSFGSSTAALDRLTRAMTQAGALGARVTGAGFGGYAIAACRADSVGPVLEAARAATGGPAFRVEASAGLG